MISQIQIHKTGVIDIKTAIQNGYLNNVLIETSKLILNQETEYLDLVPRSIIKKQILKMINLKKI